MSYTKIIQYGDLVEIHSYSKSFTPPPKHQNKKSPLPLPFTSHRSHLRRVRSFFQLVHHNVFNSSSCCFVTLTFAYDVSPKNADSEISRFFQRLQKKLASKISISYISVPELTKKGRLHYHLLVFDLPTSLISNERTTRYLQNEWGRGYLDIRPIERKTKGIASYMAKYMSKSMYLIGKKRAYNCSRNIKKVRSYGSNTIDSEIINLLVDLSLVPESVFTYNTPYMGEVTVSLFKNKNI